MAQTSKGDNKQLVKQRRRARLAAELRANLRRRKEQARNKALPDVPALAGDAPEGRPDAREAATRTMSEIA
jgi:hypothetical protein